MSSSLALPYLVLAATLVRALLVKAQIVPVSCDRCGLPRERRVLGDRICGCQRV
jgi:hypothetical protein